MRPLEESLLVLANRAEPLPIEVLLERIEWQLATADGPSTVANVEEPTMPTREPRQLETPVPTPPRRKWRRPTIAFGTTVIVTAVVFGVAGVRGVFDSEPDTAGTATTTSSAVTATTEPVPPTTEPPLPQTTVPAADTGLFDYWSLGDPAATLDSPLGTLTWIRADGIPLQRLDDGFPRPGSPAVPEALLEAFVQAPGFDVFGSEVGYLGIGPAGDPDGLRGSTRFIQSDYRLRGLTEEEDPYQVVELQQTRVRLREGIAVEQWYEGRWWGQGISAWRLPLDEVWYSADGQTWELKTDTGFEPGATMESQPYSVAEHDGRWIVIGEIAGSEADNRPAAGIPAAWTSDDLVTWTRVPIDFTKPDRITRLTSVAAGDQGWVIFGIHSTEEIPRQGEWAAWASADGLEWEPLPVEDIFDPAECGDNPVGDCQINPVFTDDALVTYVTGGGWPWIATWLEGDGS